MDLSFNHWVSQTEADEAMAPAIALLNEILDQYGKPISIKGDDPQSFFRKKYETNKGNQVVLSKYQGYQQHNPMIQAFAAQNPENFAQALLFAPLTANTSFKRFNEWFPVLMQFLRTRETTTRQEVADFISGTSGQWVGHPRGGQFSSVIDRGQGIKSKLIEYVWNNRATLFDECNKLAEAGDFKSLLYKFAMLPGVQPVKAGFVVQLLYGQMGCMDTHNIRMYTALADLMKKAPDLRPEDREKWKELGSMMRSYSWKGIEGKGTEKGAAKMDRAVEGYDKILSFMNQELGITPRVLWDVWVNYVAQRYEKDSENQYSRDQGLVHAPDDEQLLKVFGGKDRVWKRMGQQANVIAPHPSSGGVSRVHLMAAITPEELLKQIEVFGGNKYHVVNAAIRGDNEGRPALQTLSDRILDRHELSAIIAAGGRINAALAHAARLNDQTLERLEENARKALYAVLVRKYAMHPKEAEDLLNIYTITLNKLYKKHRDSIISTLRAQATKDAKKAGTYVGDDEKIGYGVDTFDPDQPFKQKKQQSLFGDDDDRTADKTDRWMKSIEPHMLNLQAAVGTRKEYEKVEKRVSDQITSKKAEAAKLKRIVSTTSRSKKSADDVYNKLNRLALKPTAENREKLKKDLAKAKAIRSEATREWEKATKALDRVEAKIRELQGELDGARNEFKNALLKAKGKAQVELDKKRSQHRKVLHGLEDEYQKKSS